MVRKRDSRSGVKRDSRSGVNRKRDLESGLSVRAIAHATPVAQSLRWQGQAPRASLLHPVWEPLTSGDPSEEAFVARCLLGAGWVGAKRRLSMLDLRVWAALCAQLRERLPTAPPDDLTLDRASTRTVQTTGYQLADMVYGEDGGKNYRLLWRSMIRLSGTTVVVHAIEQDPDLAARRVTTGYVALIGDIWEARTELNLRTPRQWGSLKGSASLKRDRPLDRPTSGGRPLWLARPRLAARAWDGSARPGVGSAGSLESLATALARWPRRVRDRARGACSPVARYRAL